jgi:hypothetical protein
LCGLRLCHLALAALVAVSAGAAAVSHGYAT